MGVTQLLFVSGASSELLLVVLFFFEKVAWVGGLGGGAAQCFGEQIWKVAGRGRVAARPRLRLALRGPSSGSDSRRINSAALQSTARRWWESVQPIPFGGSVTWCV